MQCNCYLYWEASVWASQTKPSILVSALKQFRFIFFLSSFRQYDWIPRVRSRVFDNDAYVFSLFFRKYSTKGGLSRDRTAPNPLDNIMHFVLKVSVEKGYSVTYNPLNWAEGSSALNNTIVLSLWNSCGFFSLGRREGRLGLWVCSAMKRILQIFSHITSYLYPS